MFVSVDQAGMAACEGGQGYRLDVVIHTILIMKQDRM